MRQIKRREKKTPKPIQTLSLNVKTYVNDVSKIELKDEGDSICKEWSDQALFLFGGALTLEEGRRNKGGERKYIGEVNIKKEV